MPKAKAAATAALVYIGLSVDLAGHGGAADGFQVVRNLVASFQGFNLARALLIPGLYLLFRQAAKAAPGQKKWTRAIPAAFFSLCLLVGFAFSREGSWEMLWRLSDGQILKTVFVGAAWYVALERGLAVLYALLDRMERSAFSAPATRSPEKKGFHPLQWYGRMLRERPFLTPFLTLVILYLPHILISFPAMFMGDTWSEIVQAFPELGMTGTEFLSPDRTLRPGVMINQNHPVFHTLCLHLFLIIGDGLFHSFNAGIFLYALAQATMMISAAAFAISSLSKAGLRPGWLMALAAWFLIQPQVRNFLMLVTKDGPYAACFLAAMACLFRLRRGLRTRHAFLWLCLSALGLMLFRNEGRLVLTLSGLLIALTDRKGRRPALCFVAAAAVLSAAVFNLLYPALGFTPGSIREVLSVPMQQTARVVRDHPEDIREEEREAIDRVLPYDTLAENYDPLDADPVKAAFRQEATDADLRDFLRTWAGLFLRHPDTCLQASVENYYQYFYPAEVRISHYNYGWSAWMCDYANQKIEPLGKAFSLPEWSRRLRYLSDSLFDAGLLNLPPLSGMMTPALYLWSLLILLCRAGGKRREERPAILTMLLPAAVILGLLMFGPVNAGYGRYLLPVTFSLPALGMMTLAPQISGTEILQKRKGADR